MYYEINVAKNGKHYFATAKRSIQTEDQAWEMFNHFVNILPESEGYVISVSYYMNLGKQLTLRK